MEINENNQQNGYTQMSTSEQNKINETLNEHTNQESESANNAESDFSQIKNQAEAQKMLESKGFDYSEFQKEYSATGKISKESREKLSKIGISDEFIDEYIKGQQAVLDAELNEISECIGGRQNLSQVLEWARNNLEKDEKITINKVQDRNLLKIILKDLKNRMEQNEGIMPNYVKGDGAKAFSGIFRSKAEMYEAISNPKYKKDEAYRSDVQRKISASMRAGINLGI